MLGQEQRFGFKFKNWQVISLIVFWSWVFDWHGKKVLSNICKFIVQAHLAGYRICPHFYIIPETPFNIYNIFKIAIVLEVLNCQL